MERHGETKTRIWRQVSLMDKRRKVEDMYCKNQVKAGVCVMWGNTRCLIVVLRRNTMRKPEG